MNAQLFQQVRMDIRRTIGRRGTWLSLAAALAGAALVVSGIWMLLHPSVTPFLVSGATNIQVVSPGVWEWQITYDAPGPPYAWYFTLSRIIEGQHWNDRNLWRPDGSTMFDPVVPLRFDREYAGVLRDEVVLAPDHNYPQRATIILRRRISIS